MEYIVLSKMEELGFKLPPLVKMIKLDDKIIFVKYVRGAFMPLPEDQQIELHKKVFNGI